MYIHATLQSRMATVGSVTLFHNNINGKPAIADLLTDLALFSIKKHVKLCWGKKKAIENFILETKWGLGMKMFLKVNCHSTVSLVANNTIEQDYGICSPTRYQMNYTVAVKK